MKIGKCVSEKNKKIFSNIILVNNVHITNVSYPFIIQVKKSRQKLIRAIQPLLSINDNIRNENR